MKKLVKRIDASAVTVTGQYVSPVMAVTGLETETFFLSQSLESEVVTVDPYGTVTSIDSKENEQDYFDLTF